MAIEVPLMEGGITRLQCPVSPSRLVEVGFGFGGAANELGSLWRWGALLLLAALAAYGSLISRTRLLLRRLRRGRHKPVVLQLQERHLFSDDDDTCSSCSSDDDGKEEELLSSETEDEEVVREGYIGGFPEREGQSGEFHLRRLPELAHGGREVVKAWDGQGLRLKDSTVVGDVGVFSLWDLYRGEVVRPFLAAGSSRVAACVAAAQPSVVLSAGDSIGVWDARVGGRMPSAKSPRLRWRVLRFGGEGKVVYVGDGIGSAATVDLRMPRSPARGVAEDDATWPDADFVNVGGFEEGAPWSPATNRFRRGKTSEMTRMSLWLYSGINNDPFPHFFGD